MLKKTVLSLLMIFVIFLVAFSVQMSAKILHLHLDLTANKGAGQVVLYLIVLGAVFGTVRLVWRRSIQEAAARYAGQWQRATKGFWLCAGISVGVQIVMYSLLMLFGGVRLTIHDARPVTESLVFNLTVSLIVMVVLASTEESIFRGFLFSYLLGTDAKKNLVPAVLISSMIFTLVHEFHTLQRWLEPGFFPLFIGLLLLGTLLAVTYYSTRSLACSIGVHASFLWLDRIRRDTGIIALDQNHWWMGKDNDLRTAPVVWLLFVGLAAFFWLKRTQISRLTAIERGKLPTTPHRILPNTEILEPSTQPVLTSTQSSHRRDETLTSAK